MLNKVTYVLLGIFLIIFGIFLLFKQIYHDFLYDYFYDFGKYHRLLGIILIGLGTIISYRSYKKDPKSFNDSYLICPNCRKPYNKKNITNRRCPDCSTMLEELDGFYERHPELK